MATAIPFPLKPKAHSPFLTQFSIPFHSFPKSSLTLGHTTINRLATPLIRSSQRRSNLIAARRTTTSTAMTMHCGGQRCAKDACRCTCACSFACLGPCQKCRRHNQLRQCLLSKGANICGQCCGHSICESGWAAAGKPAVRPAGGGGTSVRNY